MQTSAVRSSSISELEGPSQIGQLEIKVERKKSTTISKSTGLYKNYNMKMSGTFYNDFLKNKQKNTILGNKNNSISELFIG